MPMPPMGRYCTQVTITENNNRCVCINHSLNRGIYHGYGCVSMVWTPGDALLYFKFNNYACTCTILIDKYIDIYILIDIFYIYTKKCTWHVTNPMESNDRSSRLGDGQVWRLEWKQRMWLMKTCKRVIEASTKMAEKLKKIK